MYKDLLKKCARFNRLARSSNEYMRNYMANRYHKKRKEIIDQLGGKCKECGSDKNLHLDHIDKSKKTMRMVDVHSANDKKIQNELKNIQLLCKDCHKAKTKKVWDFSVPKSRHGTYWMYRKHKCRCENCARAYKEKLKEWREKKKMSN